MAMIFKIKSKKQEKIVKDFLAKNAIEFQTIAEEEATVYTRKNKPSKDKAKEILSDLEKSVQFVKQYKKGKTKVKSLDQLLNEL